MSQNFIAITWKLLFIQTLSLCLVSLAQTLHFCAFMFSEAYPCHYVEIILFGEMEWHDFYGACSRLWRCKSSMKNIRMTTVNDFYGSRDFRRFSCHMKVKLFACELSLWHKVTCMLKINLKYLYLITTDTSVICKQLKSGPVAKLFGVLSGSKLFETQSIIKQRK